MEHYVVINHWSNDYECGVTILSIAHTLKEAKEIFNNCVGDEKKHAEDNKNLAEELNPELQKLVEENNKLVEEMESLKTELEGLRMFKKETGLGFSKYLNSLRLQYAEHLLRSTDILAH